MEGREGGGGGGEGGGVWPGWCYYFAFIKQDLQVKTKTGH